MNKPVQAQLISVGTELLRGEIVDTNSAYIASQLPLLGIELQKINTAGDNIEQLSETLKQALAQSGLVVTTGGLGPTEDDLTREAIAAALGESLSVDPELEKELKAIFARNRREMPQSNLNQATIIPSAKSLPNTRGTAPGWWVEKNGKVIVTLPGPPREMTPMWQNEVVPRLKKRFPVNAILARTIKTFLLQEAKVAELVHPFFESENPILGIYAKSDGIQLRLIATGDNAAQLLDDAEKKMRELLKPYVWGRDNDTLEELVGNWLNRHGLTLATMEDITGGLLGNIITESPASRRYYHGGLIATNDHAKISWGVSEELISQSGAVSEGVAKAMAEAVRKHFSTDFGISITDITSMNIPGSLPQGTVFIGIADNYGTKTWQQYYFPGRADTRERAAIACLFRLRERLLELKIAD